jgi:hypothetical protein
MAMRADGADQRAAQRIGRDGHITFVAQHTLKKSRATIQDVSPTGMCLITTESLDVNQVVKIEGTMLSAVARVVSCRHRERPPFSASLVGVEFLTLDLADSRGTFVSSWI